MVIIYEHVHKDQDEILDIFYDQCYKLCSSHVPAKTNKDNIKHNKVLRYRRSLLRKRKRIKTQRTRCKSETKRERLHSDLIQIEKDMQKSHRSSAEHEENKAVESIGVNSKYF